MDDRLQSRPAMDGTPPDLMNDPQYATNTANGEDGMGDADTCRICRGEGSNSEPLFHPCKCSGSIKYVHQDCLMEWLSHSQKKHCELCKTAFRFTKLYSPNMPQTLPIHVLFRHIIIHTVKNLTTWLRFCLVVTVWLGFLPYIIRQVWRLLFWFSDGGWPPNYLTIDSTRNSTAMQALEMARELQLATLTGNGTSPVTPFLASQTTSASVGGIMDKLVGFLTPISQTLNISGSDPLAAGLFKSLYYGFGISSVVIPEGPPTNTSVSQFLMNLSPASRSPSLLSEIHFLRNLTRNSNINQLLITIAEGYIITILVVVCFILVFLIREWVVQQQPGINMGAGFNAEFAAPERAREQQVAPEPRQLPNVADLQEPRDIGQRPMARPRRRNPHFGDGDDVRPARHTLELPDSRAEAGPSVNRPTPVRDALSPAAEIQRVLTEEPRMTEEFLAIWRRADSDPKEVLRIIERENKGDQMRYWVNAMKVLQTPIPRDRQVPRTPSPTLNLDIPSIKFTSSENSSTDDLGKHTASDRSSASSESWVDVPKPLALQHHNIFSESNIEERRMFDDRPLDKGKNRAIEDPDALITRNEIVWNESNTPNLNAFAPESSSSTWTAAGPASFSSSSSRPRAVSDGPRTRESISLLANNNWSFSNLPDDDNADDKLSWNKENLGPSEDLKELSSPAELATQPILPENSQAWKAAQDLRVQQAIARGREAHKTALARHEPALATPLQVSEKDGEDAANEEDSVEKPGHATSLSRTYADGIHENPPSEESDSDHGREPAAGASEPNVLETEVPSPDAREPVAARPQEPQDFLANIADFLWGGVGDNRHQDEQGANDEHIVQDLAAEPPFVPVVHQDPFEQGGEFPEQDREVVEAAIAAGIDPNDQDAIDDAEDFEGIMELVGMRGPIFSLVQNALFSAFLLALTVAFGVWIPYNIGRVSLLLIANPGPAFKLPLRLIFGLAALMQDLALSLMGVVSYCLVKIFSLPLSIWSYYSATNSAPLIIKGISLGSAALNLSQSALDRVMDGTVNSLVHIGDSEIFAFSAASHESLIYLKNLVIDTLIAIGSTVSYIFIGDYSVTRKDILAVLYHSFTHGWHFISAVPSFLARSDSWVISLEVGKRSRPLDLELSVWDGVDRFWATVAGYTALSLLGVLYVRKGSPFSNGPVGREWEATVIDLLNQAGGVMKVILIISIEMLVFPLYCGLLLDAALLPLFENTTILSRLLFTFESPLTSIFVHWFVGTCYMFHFALFVSMCRKIMRKGVLCKFSRISLRI
jgi:E3 ubiquitin-protein ligase MARCH6